jgi:putative flippase GtrA
MGNMVQMFKFAAVGCVNTMIDRALYFIILKITFSHLLSPCWRELFNSISSPLVGED